MTFKYHLDHQVCSIYVRSIYSSDNPYHINVSVRELDLFLANYINTHGQLDGMMMSVALCETKVHLELVWWSFLP